MKTIGLIGGMSWESTATYYKIINEEIKAHLGGLHSAKILLYSVDFAEIEELQVNGEWERAGDILAGVAKNLELAGADFIAICTNTMHKVEPQIKANLQIPVLHIATATADELKAKNIDKTILLGTKYTMTQDFYKQKLIEQGIEVFIPNDDEIEFINSVIFNELCLGKILSSSKDKFLKIIDRLANLGAKSVILGCTEIGLLISQNDLEIPVFDTTIIHAKKCAKMAL
ncbi:MAG: aspartate/glutamate racemase family protein [Campylobacter sp.]|nr:aspartate/glutamate racemase family protein [Campylobacter sp.]